jgi:DNA-binding XRE family transcriptional regulator
MSNKALSHEEIRAKYREINDNTEFPDWESIKQEIFTPEEIAANDLKVAIIGELIKARNEQGISQKKLEELSGVKQPIIARMEKGYTNPQIDTLLKLLAPLGKTLVIAPLEHTPAKL